MIVKLDLQALDNLRGQSITRLKEATGEIITEFTCDDCDSRFTCCYVFDIYNTDGDCLAMK